MCENLEAFGYHYDGGDAEYFVVSAVSIRRDSIKPLPDQNSTTLRRPLWSFWPA
jgi:D-arabinose 1-dehydrogenase-like Zn-dependent alcohol dehydrogenase